MIGLIGMLSRVRFRPNLRRGVFWISLAVMLGAGLTGLTWAVLTHEFGTGPMTALAVGIGALAVALIFGLLDFTNPTFHPESHLFDWHDVDTLRTLARQGELDEPTREWARSLSDRIAIVLPGRSAPGHDQGQGHAKSSIVRRS
jgi:hypothetical protein